MKPLSVKEKIEIIQTLAKTHNITAYEIGKNTGISNVTAHRILTGENKTPKINTLNMILGYIENKLLNKSNKNHAAGYSTEGANKLANDVSAVVLEKLQPYLNKIEINQMLLNKVLLECIKLNETIKQK